MTRDQDKTQEYNIADDFERLRQRVNDCERRYQTLVETNLYGIQVIDNQGGITYVNTTQCQALGYHAKELEGRNVWELLATDGDRKRLTDHLMRLSNETVDRYTWSGRFVRKDGEPVELKLNWNCMRNEQGQVTGFVSLAVDIPGDLRRDGGSLHRPGTAADGGRHRSIVEGVREMILTCDGQGRIIYMNEWGLEGLGYFEEELREMNLADILPPDQLKKIQEQAGGEEPGRSPDGPPRRIDFINRRLDLVPLDTAVTWIRAPGREPEMVIVGRDLTDRLLRDREIIRGEKRASVVTMAQGLLADLKDLSARIVGNIDVAQGDATPGGSIHQRLGMAKDACARVQELTRSLEAVSDGRPLQKKTVSLAKLIRAIAERTITDPNIRMIHEYADGLWPVPLDVSKIHAAVSHLLKNAREAMDQGGRIRITAVNAVVSGEEDPLAEVLTPGNYVLLSIEDSGTGIPQADLERVFDPYYTTKAGSGRRGLGLALVQAAVRQHQGTVWAESKPKSKAKTAFRIYLPATKPPAAPPQSKPVLV